METEENKLAEAAKTEKLFLKDESNIKPKPKEVIHKQKYKGTGFRTTSIVDKVKHSSSV